MDEQYAFLIKDGNINAERIIQSKLHIGGRTVKCKHCEAMLWEREPLGMCCDNGKVKLDKFPELPPVLQNLYEGQSEESKKFRANINAFNSAFCMTSFGVDRYMPPGRGPPTFHIQGVPSHQHGSLMTPTNSHRPRYAQLYLIDTDQAAQERYFIHTKIAFKTLVKL